MTLIVDFTVYGDLPAVYTDAQIEGVSAGVVQLLMQAQELDGDSVVRTLSKDPASSVANPQVPGFQLCKCDLVLSFPDGVDLDSTEMLVASGLADYSARMGLPGNVIVTLNWSSTTASLGTPTRPQFPAMSAAGQQRTTATAELS